MNRRTFNKILSGAATLGGVTPGVGGIAQAHSIDSAGDVKFATKWPGQVYRRLLIDTHIPDWDPLFLSRFDTAEYVDIIARAGFQNHLFGAIRRGIEGKDDFIVLRYAAEDRAHTTKIFGEVLLFPVDRDDDTEEHAGFCCANTQGLTIE